MNGTPLLRSRGRATIVLLALAMSGFVSGGCTTTITQAHTDSEAVAHAAKLDAKNARVVLMPIDIELTQLTAAGLEEPKAEWTAAARHHVNAALTTAMAERGLTLHPYKKPKSRKRAYRDEQLEKLHNTVGGTVLFHHYNQMAWLPTKQGKMDWTLGKTARSLGNEQNAEFALFVFLRDSYGTSGRKAAMVVGSIIGAGIKAGERVGYASLVDLRTGDVVWFNVLYSDSGDMRVAEAAREVIDDLITGFPL